MTVFISKFAKNISEGIKKVNKGICIEIGVLFAPISYVILECIGVKIEKPNKYFANYQIVDKKYFRNIMSTV